MLDSIHHMTLKIPLNCIFGVNTLSFCHNIYHVVMEVIT